MNFSEQQDNDYESQESDYHRYMHSDCADYAVCLQILVPELKFGLLLDPTDNSPIHAFAHDHEYAYDYSGCHKLPYHGLWPNSISQLNQTLEDIENSLGYIADSVNDCLQVIADHDAYSQLNIQSIPWSVL
jgi:hypothetical protein